MTTREDNTPSLPVGFENFHKQRFINYQLNRAHALGFADRAELQGAADQIGTFDDCVEVFDLLAQDMRRAGRLTEAASYLRIAEFFTPQMSTDKADRYARYRSLFDEAFEGRGATRHTIAYEDSAIPAYTLGAKGTSKGTVLFHGGFDSVIEEFFVVWDRLSAAGYDVIAFEGPGQGGARAIGGLTLDHDWEKPVGAVLDHFSADDATLIGLSMGGYWAVRAAGREPRISRLVIWPPVFDWLAQLPRVVRPIVAGMLRMRRFMNWSIGIRAKLVPVLKHAINQALYLSGGSEPMDAVNWFLGMNEEHIGSDRVTQDVLVLVGERDRFQPPKLADRQISALTNTRSLEVRRFTREEHADSHCQMGNFDLALSTIIDWLDRNR